MADRDFYWYKRGGFVLAVDAMNAQDAHKHVKTMYGEMEYQGAWPAPSAPNYTAACCSITPSRQEQISANLRRQGIIN